MPKPQCNWSKTYDKEAPPFATGMWACGGGGGPSAPPGGGGGGGGPGGGGGMVAILNDVAHKTTEKKIVNARERGEKGLVVKNIFQSLCYSILQRET